MASLIKSLFLISCFIFALKYAESLPKRSVFKEKPMLEQVAGLKFKKIVGMRSKSECAIRCTKRDACRSFYVDDGACVFGLRDDVTEFANGDDVTPADRQILMTKRKSLIPVNFIDFYLIKFTCTCVYIHSLYTGA